MAQLDSLIGAVGIARQQFIRAASGLTYEQSQFRPTPETWSVVDNVEHMYWAELGGINGMWKTFEAMKINKPLWSGDAVHHGLPIEVIIEKTWKEKEQVPEIAKPRWGGSVDYWIAALNTLQPLLETLGHALKGQDLEKIIYPHIISGPLNVIQRLEFLRFHLNRHQVQVSNLRLHPEFPR